MFSYESFTRAVRSKQYFENVFGSPCPSRKRKHEKYETECQVVGMVLTRKGFALKQSFDRSPYSQDLYNVPRIFDDNLDKFFSMRVKGFETSSIRMKTVSFTVAEEEIKQRIELKTKEELITMIGEIAANLSDVEYIVSSCTKSKTKQFLINMYHELLEEQRQEGLNLSIEQED